MMQQILHGIENPNEDETKIEVEEIEYTEKTKYTEYTEDAQDDDTPETRKTIAQTLREWDVSSVERVVIEEREGDKQKPIIRPWFSRKD